VRRVSNLNEVKPTSGEDAKKILRVLESIGTAEAFAKVVHLWDQNPDLTQVVIGVCYNLVNQE